MRRRLAVDAFFALATAFTLGCLTINVYFPEAEIKDLSEQIESEVQKKAAEKGPGSSTEPDAEDPGGDGVPSGGGAFGIEGLFGITPAHAQDVVPAPEVTNPAIRKIIDLRARRLPEINRYKSLGVIGENNRALLEVRAIDSLDDLKARAEVQRLVKAENADREELFREIAAAKGVDLSQLPRIQETYAATLRENARPGDWIQLPDGKWTQK